MVNLPTKFEVPSITRFGDMKCVAKCKKMGWFAVVRSHPRSSAMSPFGRAHYDFLFVFDRNYASIMCRFRDIASYLSKFDNFDLPHLHLTPLEFRENFWLRKTRVPGLSTRCLRVPMSRHFSRTPTCDRQTDGQKDRYTTMAYTVQSTIKIFSDTLC